MPETAEITHVLHAIGRSEEGAAEKLDEALARLKLEGPELERIVVLKFFGALSNAEIAETLGLANRTPDRQWAYARAWLFRYISEQK